MSGEDDLSDLLGPEPLSEDTPIEEPVAIASRPMGEASRALLERSRSYDLKRAVPKKNSPERLARLVSAIADLGVTSDACRRSGISVTTLKYWCQKSLEGAPGDGFDMVLGEDDENEGGNTIRFHDAWDLGMLAGVEKVEASVMRRAIGYREVLTYQGRVIYQKDPRLTGLGLPPEDEYLLDEFGAPVPETVEKMDPDLAMFILKQRKPKEYGPKASLDVNVKGGVLVVPMRTIVAADLNEIESNYRKEGRPQVSFIEGDEDPVDGT